MERNGGSVLYLGLVPMWLECGNVLLSELHTKPTKSGHWGDDCGGVVKAALLIHFKSSKKLSSRHQFRLYNVSKRRKTRISTPQLAPIA